MESGSVARSKVSDEIILSMNESVLNHFGVDSQLHKLEEELTELLLVTKRVRSGRENLFSFHFLEEVADVENILSQIKIEIQRESLTSARLEYSVERELNRIKMNKLNKVFHVNGLSL